MEELKETAGLDEQTTGPDQDPELWDWARTAGLSREELLVAVRQTRPAVN
jgi:hypothetical protein